MAKEKEIVLIKAKKSELLTKQQKKFNQLNKHIANLQQQLKEEEQRLNKLHELYAEEIEPRKKKSAQNKLKIAHLFNNALDKYKFGVRQTETIIQVILFLCDTAFSIVQPSKKDEALFDKWSEKTYKQELEAEDQESKDFFAEQFKNLFGIDIDFNNNAESFAKFEEEIKAKMANSGYENPFNKSANKKKTKKQLENEKITLQEQQKQQKSIRSIYLSLAKVLHPDVAINEQDRLEKESLMKQITVAYKNNDLPTLLRLESYWVSSTTNNIDNLTEEKLKMYVKILQTHKQELEQELWALQQNPKYDELGDLTFFTEKTAIQEIDKLKKDFDVFLATQNEDYNLLAQSTNKNDFIDFAKSLSYVMEQYYD